MPLYELILVCRCAQASNTANALKIVSNTILSEGGNIRNCRILGDRILSKQLMGKDGMKHLIGRYVQILYDGHPQYFRQINKTVEDSFECLRSNHFKVKDFVGEAINFTKPLEEEAPFIKNSSIESTQYSDALKVIREEKYKQEQL